MTDNVNHPQHYGGDTTYETIKVIEAWGLGFALGNAVKYISRAEHKANQLEDLRKAAWYLQHEIDRLEKADTEQQLNLAQAGPGCNCWCPHHLTRGCVCPCVTHSAEANT